jgi:hypothetical protein
VKQRKRRKRVKRETKQRRGHISKCQSESVEGIQTEMNSPMVTKQRHRGGGGTRPRRVTDVVDIYDN